MTDQDTNTAIFVAEMRTDIKYIRESIDVIFKKLSKQDDFNESLLKNCNREERWTNIGDRVENIDTRLNRIEKAKCPKLPVIESIDERLTAVESLNHMDAGAKKAARSSVEYVLAGFAIVEGIIIIWQFLKPGVIP